MRRACADNWENIVELAEGRENAAAQAHLDSCPACTAQYWQLAKMMNASARGFANAPADLLERAIGLMPQRAKVRAGLLRTTLGLAGARAEADDFQLVVSVADQPIRIMYVREENGWEVIGKLPATDWQVERAGATLETDERGRFSFKCVNLNETAFEMVHGNEVIEVPSAEELLVGAV